MPWSGIQQKSVNKLKLKSEKQQTPGHFWQLMFPPYTRPRMAGLPATFLLGLIPGATVFPQRKAILCELSCFSWVSCIAELPGFTTKEQANHTLGFILTSNCGLQDLPLPGPHPSLIILYEPLLFLALCHTGLFFLPCMLQIHFCPLGP